MADRTVEEIETLREAAGLYVGFDRGQCVAWKGEPPVVICAEPMMTASFEFYAPGATVAAERTVSRVPVVGPVTRMAIALHLGLTPGEAIASGWTAEAAEQELQERMLEAAARVGKEIGADLTPLAGHDPVILPSSPRWIEQQRAADEQEARRG